MKLFVANIARESSEEELHTAFSDCGEIKSLKIIKDKDTGQSRGFGFVEMETREGGEKAMQDLHEKEFHGRALVVNEAKEQQRRAPHGGVRGGLR
jgi:RNA recognition motif-containing protein